MFDISTLPYICIEEDQINNFKISKINNNTFVLSNKDKQLMTYGKWHNIQAKELYSSYDLAKGNVALSGLGFGVLALWVANKPGVKTVTVFENSQEIIHMFLKHNICPYNLKIVCADINEIVTDEHYDCLFLDHYEKEDTLTKYMNMSTICENIPNHDIFWAWSLEKEYIKLMYRLSDYFMLDHDLTRNIIDFSEKWEDFIKNVFPLKNIPKLNNSKINEYIYTYFDKIGYTIP